MGIYIYTYIYVNTICLSVCVCVCLYLNTGLTAARINLIFGMHTLIWSDCAIGYMILTFKVIKGHFRSNKFLWLGRQCSLAGTAVAGLVVCWAGSGHIIYISPC